MNYKIIKFQEGNWYCSDVLEQLFTERKLKEFFDIVNVAMSWEGRCLKCIKSTTIRAVYE